MKRGFFDKQKTPRRPRQNSPNKNGRGGDRRSSPKKKQPYFKQHILEVDANELIRNGEAIEGPIKTVSLKIGFVNISGTSLDILVPDDKRRNRALNGDIVVIKLLAREDWKSVTKSSMKDALEQKVADGEVSAEEAEALKKKQEEEFEDIPDIDLWSPKYPTKEDGKILFIPNNHLSGGQQAV
eukprot:TRINITY_DN4025_c0_g1_i1.p1 TRINITY_DN4025_c0_g1~~TRINITY_DN4025_c0_g1_i1.p1  ORF type:complete len:206 (-),score=65.74 TRINITY_DN4025_c0_g1_i1:57-605(-)